MALKDMMKNAADAAVSKTQEAISRDRESAQSNGATGIISGLTGGFTEMSADTALKDYGMYLMEDETFGQCFLLLRDKLLFTNRRIIFIDHQGATGVKTSVESINLGSIVSVRLETGGFGFDHAEIEMTYLLTPYSEPITHKLEFPNGFDVQSLYLILESYAQSNVEALMRR